MGGWPTTAFLTPEGEILAGATYVPPDQMKELLPKVNVHWQPTATRSPRRPRELRERRDRRDERRARRHLSQTSSTTSLAASSTNYDPVYGGFGDAPKFPHTDAIDLLLYAYRKNGDPDVLHMARKTLEFMCARRRLRPGVGRLLPLRHPPRLERPALREDARGQRAAALEPPRALPHHRRTTRTRETARGRSSTSNGSCATRSAASSTARRTPTSSSTSSRRRAASAPRSRTSTAPATRAGTRWRSQPTSKPRGRSTARTCATRAVQALDFLWNECRDAERGMYRFHDGTEPRVLGLLGDQAHTARALLDAHEVTGDSTHLDRALELARFLLDRFVDRENGGFYDVWDEVEDVGRLKDRQKSIQDNTVCAEVFLRLHHLTRDDDYRDDRARHARGVHRAPIRTWATSPPATRARWTRSSTRRPRSTSSAIASSAAELHGAALCARCPIAHRAGPRPGARRRAP